MSKKHFSVAIPHLIRILVFPIDQNQKTTLDGKVLQHLRSVYPESIMENSNKIRIPLNIGECSIKVTKKMDCQIFTVIVGSQNSGYVSKNWERDLVDYFQQTNHILRILPKNPISEFTVFIGVTDSQDDAISPLQ